MKHKLVIAAVATAALALGGTAIAFTDDASAGVTAAGFRAGDDRDGRDDDRNDGGGDDDDRRELRSARVTLQEAVEAALKAVPGTAESAELDDDDDRLAWDVDILGEDGTWYDVRIDAGSADVLGQQVDQDDDDDRDDRDDRDDDRDDRDDRDDD